jgi:cytochrome c oxidase cbb3-type subunit 3
MRAPAPYLPPSSAPPRDGDPPHLPVPHLPTPGGTRRVSLIVALALLASGCGREDRDFRTAPPAASPPGEVRTSALQAGPVTPDPSIAPYENNAWAIAEGKRLYSWYNCAGCHAPGGGGAMGPPLIDDEWIYGGQPDNLFASIVEGRPNGMPSFRGRIGNAEVWKLVAYVRYLNGQARLDVKTGRMDEMQAANSDDISGSPVPSTEATVPSQNEP